MTETTTISANAPKSKTKPATGFEVPKFELPKFEMPAMEVPAAYRELAEKGISQAKANYENIRAVAEDATVVLEETYAKASKGACDYGLKVIDTARVNANSAFDLVTKMMSAKSYADLVEISTSYLHTQFDTLVTQSKDLAECAQKVATETAEPIKDGINSAIKKAA
jgi:phasin